MARRTKARHFENVPVVDIADRGRAVAKTDSGEVIFVAGAVPGDVVDIRTQKRKKSFWLGTVERIREESSDRVAAFCPHFGTCGGCKYQHMSYDSQLRFKHKRVVESLERIAKAEIPEVPPVLPAPETRYYRNRLDFAFADQRWLTQEEIIEKGNIEDRRGIGFHIPGRFDKILDVQHCFLQPEPSNTIRDKVKAFALEKGYPFHNPVHKDGFLRSLIIRTSTLGETMVILVAQSGFDAELEEMKTFMQQMEEITSLYVVINDKPNDTIFDLEHQLVSGPPHLREQVGEMVYRMGPKSFFQTNSHGTEQLYSVAKDFAGFQDGERLLDLYCGVGTIGLYMADTVKELVGIETIPEAIDFARLNASDNGVANADFFAGQVEDVLNEHFMQQHEPFDVIVTDPPRMGMHPRAVKLLGELSAPKIVYISCNPATQARDIEMLADQYTVKRVQPVDMFPHTDHVENVLLLEKR